jgi:hypothetical protein
MQKHGAVCPDGGSCCVLQSAAVLVTLQCIDNNACTWFGYLHVCRLPACVCLQGGLGAGATAFSGAHCHDAAGISRLHGISVTAPA